MTKEYSDSDGDSDVGSTYCSTYSSINSYHPLFDFDPYGPALRSVTMKESVGNLIFRDLRHEQRRVAAMIPINRVEQPQHVKAPRTSLLPLTLPHPCSHLDPDGLCRDPSHRYLHQHPAVRTSDIIHRLREGFSYIRDRNNELFHEQGSGTIRGWTGEKRTRFDAVDLGIARGQKDGRQGNRDPGYFHHDGGDSESESGIDDEESESDSEDKLHVKIPTEGDDRKGVRRLKGKNENKNRQKALDKVRKYATESGEYVDEEGALTSDRSHGKHRGNHRGTNGEHDRGQSHSGDRHYDREVSHNWRDEDSETPRGTFLSYNHGQAPNPVGKEYVSKLESGKIIRSPPRDRLFEKRNDVFTSNNGGTEYRNNFVNERSDSFHRQSLSRKNTFEAEGGLIRVTSFVSEPSFCNCSSPGVRMSSRENSSSEDCRRCGKRLKLQRDSSGVFERHGSSDYSRESSGEFVRKRRDSGEYRVGKRKEKTPEQVATPKGDVVQAKESKVVAKKSKKKRKIPKPGQATDPDYMDKLRERLKDGEFDVDLNDLPSLDDINQKLHFDKEEEEEEDHYERKFVRPPLRYDQYRDAYLKALSVVRGKLLPTESWMFELNTTKSFVFSYFYGGYPKPRILDESRTLPAPELPKKAKKGAEMKMIFGSENPDDYIPGGSKNPSPGQFATSPRKGKKGKKGGKKVKF